MNRLCFKVKFNNEDDLFQFNKWANNRPYNIDVKYNSKILDGKSLIGLMGMDISNPVIVILYIDKEYEFIEKFDKIILDKVEL